MRMQVIIDKDGNIVGTIPAPGTSYGSSDDVVDSPFEYKDMEDSPLRHRNFAIIISGSEHAIRENEDLKYFHKRIHEFVREHPEYKRNRGS